MWELVLITDSMRNNRTYDGNTKKFGVTMNNKNYIIKMQKKGSLSVCTEYIASNFIRTLGIPCHKVDIGLYNNQVVDVIEDFTSGTNISLVSFKDTKQSSEDTDISTKEYTYDDVIYLIKHHLKIKDMDKAIVMFWRMFICDAIIGNRDRHWGNWGYLSNGKEYRFAPLYDNGGGLYPDVLKVISGYRVNEKKFIYDRVFVFPASLFKIKKPDRSNYAEMFKDLRINKVFAQEVRSIREHFKYIDIYKIIYKVVISLNIDNTLKRFYIQIVTLRYMCIILRMDYNKAYGIVYKLLERNGL